VVLDAGAILAASPELAVAAGVLGLSPLDLALGGGEDYALLAAWSPRSPSEEAIPGFVRIGEVLARDAAHEPLVWLEDAAGRRPIDPVGFDHFA
jgi:thiamine-monophosphate kinase